MKLNLDTLSRNIKLLRLTNGFSQEELSQRLFVSRTAYIDFEKCTRAPDLQTLDALAEIYCISLDTLVFHDLSQRPLCHIYLNDNQRRLCTLLSEYENLTVSSKGIIMERIDTLLEREEIFYSKHIIKT